MEASDRQLTVKLVIFWLPPLTAAQTGRTGRVVLSPHPRWVCCSSHHSIRCTLGELVLQAHSHQLHHCHMDASLIRTVSKQEKGNEAVNKKKRTILILFAVQP